MTAARGVGHVLVRLRSGGEITAGYLGSASRLAATATRHFVVKSSTHWRFGPHRTVGAVAHFASRSAFGATFRTTPFDAGRACVMRLDARRGGKWHQLAVAHGNFSQSSIHAYLIKATPHIPLRIRFASASDQWSTASHATTSTFEID